MFSSVLHQATAADAVLGFSLIYISVRESLGKMPAKGKVAS
jgi:hypothetical protein